MEIKRRKKLDKDDYLLIAMVLLIVFQITIVVGRLIRKESPWINVGCVSLQSCLFIISLKNHLKYRERQRETFQKYIKEEYAREQILNQCQNCSYYQGQIHGGNLLVCVLHPYGQEDCPDCE